MSVVKKVLEKLKKPKKNDSSVCASDQLCKDAVPDAPRDLKSDVPLKEDLYKNFKIDNTCKFKAQSKQTSNGSNVSGTSSFQENNLNYFQPSSLSSEAVPVVDISSRQRSISAPQESTQNVLSEYHSTTNERDLRSNDRQVHECGSGSGSESSSESENNVPSRSENSSVSLSNRNDSSIEQKRPPQKKSNTYVININNSKHFQIGSQKNMYVNGPENASLKIETLKSNENQQNIHPQNDLLNVTRPITTQELTKIASCINDNWEEIARHLGITQAELDEIVMVNDNNSNVIAFDMFKRFLEKNPETSVGFVANVLVKSNQFRAIEQLAS